MKITLASCYGFCLGVENALRILRQAKQDNSEKITLLSPIVHNSLIMENIAKDGYFVLDDNRSLAEKINSLDQGTIVFSAHGHDKRLDQLAIDKGLKIIDTTCPRVKANFKSIEKALEEGDDVIFIGITNHPETLASLSLDKNIIFLDFKNPDYSVLKKGEYASVHNQTTLIQDALNPIYDVIRKYYSHVKIINDICFATKKRQQALDEVSDEDFIIVIGDKISSNSTRLFELAKQKYPNKRVFLVNSLDEVKRINFSKNEKGFITAGASTPKEVINPIIEYLKSY